MQAGFSWINVCPRLQRCFRKALLKRRAAFRTIRSLQSKEKKCQREGTGIMPSNKRAGGITSPLPSPVEKSKKITVELPRSENEQAAQRRPDARPPRAFQLPIRQAILRVASQRIRSDFLPRLRAETSLSMTQPSSPRKTLAHMQMETETTACRHADEWVSRPEAYLGVRRDQPALCFDTGKDEGNPAKRGDGWAFFGGLNIILGPSTLTLRRFSPSPHPSPLPRWLYIERRPILIRRPYIGDFD